MFWWLSVGFAIAGSIACFAVGLRNPAPLPLWAYLYFLLPVVFVVIPYYLRTRGAVIVAAILLSLFCVLPWSFSIGIFFYPAAILMIIAAAFRPVVKRRPGT
jgi:hypothetical protein